MTENGIMENTITLFFGRTRNISCSRCAKNPGETGLPFSHFICTPHVKDIKFDFLCASGLQKLSRSFQVNNEGATA
jgi:hypothetical protein